MRQRPPTAQNRIRQQRQAHINPHCHPYATQRPRRRRLLDTQPLAQADHPILEGDGHRLRDEVPERRAEAVADADVARRVREGGDEEADVELDVGGGGASLWCAKEAGSGFAD